MLAGVHGRMRAACIPSNERSPIGYSGELRPILEALTSLIDFECRTVVAPQVVWRPARCRLLVLVTKQDDRRWSESVLRQQRIEEDRHDRSLRNKSIVDSTTLPPIRVSRGDCP